MHLYFFLHRDEDMQSLASLMSVKPTDIGNLDDFNESDEEEDKRSSTGVRLSTATPGIKKHNQTMFFTRKSGIQRLIYTWKSSFRILRNPKQQWRINILDSALLSCWSFGM